MADWHVRDYGGVSEQFRRNLAGPPSAAMPNRMALRTADANLTFAESDGRGSATAKRLRDEGAVEGSLVPLRMAPGARVRSAPPRRGNARRGCRCPVFSAGARRPHRPSRRCRAAHGRSMSVTTPDALRAALYVGDLRVSLARSISPFRTSSTAPLARRLRWACRRRTAGFVAFRFTTSAAFRSSRAQRSAAWARSSTTDSTPTASPHRLQRTASRSSRWSRLS